MTYYHICFEYLRANEVEKSNSFPQGYVTFSVTQCHSIMAMLRNAPFGQDLGDRRGVIWSKYLYQVYLSSAFHLGQCMPFLQNAIGVHDILKEVNLCLHQKKNANEIMNEIVITKGHYYLVLVISLLLALQCK